MIEWTFVPLYGVRYFSRKGFNSETSPVHRWRPDGRPATYGVPIADHVFEWLEANCKGRWYYVNNRRFTTIEQITVTHNEQEELRLARKLNMVTEEMRDKFRSIREIAFESKSDALLFKLSIP